MDTSNIKVGDMIHLRGEVVKVDHSRIDGLPFGVLHDGGTTPVFLSAESIVRVEPSKPSTLAEFRALPREEQDTLLERWMKRGDAKPK